jgi:hypothetical protein
MTREALTIACASSWASPLSLPFWMPSLTRRSAKVRFEGKLHSVYLDQQRLALHDAEGELVWVSFDEATHFYSVHPEELAPGQLLRVDGVLQSSRIQASDIRRL